MSVDTAEVSASPALALVSAKVFLDGVSDHFRSQFRKHQACTIGTNRRLHAIVWTPAFGGVLLPVPACRVGVSGWRLDRLQPADPREPGAVICARHACKGLLTSGHRSAPRVETNAQPGADDPWVQQPLFILGQTA